MSVVGNKLISPQLQILSSLLCIRIRKSTMFIVFGGLKVMLAILKREQLREKLMIYYQPRYLVTYHSKSLLTRMVLMLRKGLHDIPACQIYQWSNFDKVPFRTWLTYTPENCTIIFILPNHLKQGTSKIGLR